MALKDTAIRMALAAPETARRGFHRSGRCRNLPARHQTARHHRRTMHVPLSPERFHPADGTMDRSRSAATAAWHRMSTGRSILTMAGRQSARLMEPTESKRKILANTGHLRHQFQDIPFRIAESHHPKIVAWHWRNQPRWRFDFRAQLEKLAVRGVDIGNPEVQDGARVIQLGRFRRA